MLSKKSTWKHKLVKDGVTYNEVKEFITDRKTISLMHSREIDGLKYVVTVTKNESTGEEVERKVETNIPDQKTVDKFNEAWKKNWKPQITNAPNFDEEWKMIDWKEDTYPDSSKSKSNSEKEFILKE